MARLLFFATLFPIDNLDLNELVQPFIAITSVADHLEAIFTGNDRL